MAESTDELPMTEYEQRSLKNIEMISSLNINSILSDPSPTPEDHREGQKRIYEGSSSSLRTQGIPASHPSWLSYDNPNKLMTCLSNERPITMRNVYKGVEGAYSSFLQRLIAIEMDSVTNVGRLPVQEPVEPESFKLKSENVTKIVPRELTVIRFLPILYPTVVVAGSRFGYLGVWVAPSEDADEVGQVHLYQPHSSTVRGISVHPFFPTKIYSCSSDGLLRMMNIEWEAFDLVCSTRSGSAIVSLSQPPNDANSIYIGDGLGGLSLYDARAGDIVNSWLLHKDRINTIDFNPSNTNFLATASTDGQVCLWDLRKIDNRHSDSEAFKAFTHERSMLSAYFSPSGSCLAITSAAHRITVLEGADFEENHIIHRGHLGCTPNTCSRAIWGWDDTYLYMGCEETRVEVLSVPERKRTAKLKSSLVSSIPSKFDAHPFNVGMLVGASCSKAFLWTSHDYY